MRGAGNLRALISLLASVPFADGAYVGVEYLGSVLYPVGHEISISDSVTATLAGISAVKFSRKADGSHCDPFAETCTVFALADNGKLYECTLDIRDGSLNDTSISWAAKEPLQIKSAVSNFNDTVRGSHDTEGLAVKNADTMWVSLEGRTSDGSISDIQQMSISTGEMQDTPAFSIPAELHAAMGSNKGLEPLCRTPDGSKLVTATEMALSIDDDRVHRLMEFSSSGGAPIRQAKYLTEPGPGADDPSCGFVEIETEDDHGLDGGKFLTLERFWSGATGNIIRLFHVATPSGADEVSSCAALTGNGTSECNGIGSPPEAAAKTMLFEWKKGATGSDGESGVLSSPDGNSWNVAVDNYEAMALVPMGASSHKLLLLVNDDNANVQQIGTQFVLLRLLEDSGSSGTSGSSGSSGYSAVVSVALRSTPVLMSFAMFSALALHLVQGSGL